MARLRHSPTERAVIINSLGTSGQRPTLERAGGQFRGCGIVVHRFFCGKAGATDVWGVPPPMAAILHNPMPCIDIRFAFWKRTGANRRETRCRLRWALIRLPTKNEPGQASMRCPARFWIAFGTTHQPIKSVQVAVTSPKTLRDRRSIQPSEPISRAKALPNELGAISGTATGAGPARRKP